MMNTMKWLRFTRNQRAPCASEPPPISTESSTCTIRLYIEGDPPKIYRKITYVNLSFPFSPFTTEKEPDLRSAHLPRWPYSRTADLTCRTVSYSSDYRYIQLYGHFKSSA